MQFNFAPVLLPVKHQQQQMPGECLVASAMMALGYLGAGIDYQRLLRFLRIQPSIGTPFSNIRELSKLRVTVTYRQGTLLDLHRCLYSGLPCIVSVRTGQLPYWDNIDTQHAVVVVDQEVTSAQAEAVLVTRVSHDAGEAIVGAIERLHLRERQPMGCHREVRVPHDGPRSSLR